MITILSSVTIRQCIPYGSSEPEECRKLGSALVCTQGCEGLEQLGHKNK